MWWNSSRAIQNSKRWCHQGVAFNVWANLEDPVVASGLEKVNPHPVPKNSSTKECANHRTVALISHASKVMLKVLHARLQHYANQELPDIQAGFRKCRGTRGQLSTFTGSQRKQGNSRKTSTSVSSTTLKSLTVWVITNSGKLLERWEYQTIYLSPEKFVCRSRSNS